MDTFRLLLLILPAVIYADLHNCPGEQVWNSCGSHCTATCDDPFPICAAVCKARCECPDHAPIYHDGQCQPLEKCPGKCPEMVCTEPCPGGEYAKDENGCPTCICLVDEPNVGELKPQGDAGVLCPEIECPNYCPGGYKDDKDGCMLCECQPQMLEDLCEGVECADGKICKVFMLTRSRHRVSRCIDPSWPARCQFPMDAGPCKGFRSAWYFDQKKQQCMEFTYGGCKGNWNNFESAEKCEQQCLADPAIVCPVMQCAMECENDFAMDDNGCYMCACGDRDGKLLPTPKPCPDPAPMCMIECERGFKKDEGGCMLCECVEDPCAAAPNCLMQCDYGFLKDDYGCDVCYCAEDPCTNKECDSGLVCLAKQDSPDKWTTQCVDPEASRVWCVGSPMCLVECEHGFSQDSRGCPVCQCRDGPPACTLQECTEACPYGNMYDQTGCRMCECLPNPCLMQNCGEGMACEEVGIKECPECPHTDRCIDGRTAQRVTVNLNFGHGMFEAEEFQSGEFIREFERRASRIMGIDDEYIRDVKLKFESTGELSVRFHVVTYGEIDIVHAYNNFRNKVAEHEPGTAVPIAGVDFVPVHESLSAEYSSQPVYYDADEFDGADDEDDEDEGGATMTIIIVACACGAAVFLVVLIVLIVTLKRARVNHKHTPTTPNIIYKKAPTSEAAAKRHSSMKAPPPKADAKAGTNATTGKVAV